MKGAQVSGMEQKCKGDAKFYARRFTFNVWELFAVMQIAGQFFFDATYLQPGKTNALGVHVALRQEGKHR